MEPIKTRVMLEDVSVMLHAWRLNDEGDQEYTDGIGVDGWCVYVREDYPPGTEPPFDIVEDYDFDTYEAALAFAQDLAAQYGTEVEEY